MDKQQYCSKVTAVLDSHLNEIGNRLNRSLERIPSNTKDITIGIHVDQDGEGFLDLMVHLGGPDLYVLNKAISETARLFDTTMDADGLHPPLPLMEPHGEEFYVPDVLTDCAIEWVKSNWGKLIHTEVGIPVSVGSMEGYGQYGLEILESIENGA